jgi:outer membrane immunogenic protein
MLYHRDTFGANVGITVKTRRQSEQVIRKTSSGALMLAAVGSMPVRAADAPAMAPAPVYNWNGLYIGANFGGGFGSSSINEVGLPSNIVANGSYGISDSSSGLIAGGQVGFNWQLAPLWVLGLETDFDSSGIRQANTISGSSVTDSAGGEGAPGNSVTASQKLG